MTREEYFIARRQICAVDYLVITKSESYGEQELSAEINVLLEAYCAKLNYLNNVILHLSDIWLRRFSDYYREFTELVQICHDIPFGDNWLHEADNALLLAQPQHKFYKGRTTMPAQTVRDFITLGKLVEHETKIHYIDGSESLYDYLYYTVNNNILLHSYTCKWGFAFTTPMEVLTDIYLHPEKFRVVLPAVGGVWGDMLDHNLPTEALAYLFAMNNYVVFAKYDDVYNVGIYLVDTEHSAPKPPFLDVSQYPIYD